MSNYPTPHIKATPDDIAKTVLMPGDPLRSEFVAKNFLENAKLFNNVRGVNGYTGYYKGERVSVMASGMGIPSIGIYSYELYSFFGVENIMRIGSAGSLREDIKVRDIVIGMGASTNSNYASQYGLPGSFSAIADYSMLECAVETAKKMEHYDAVVWAHHGLFCSADNFDNAIGFAHCVEKSADIYMKVRAVTDHKLQTITKENFLELAKDFGLTINEAFLN